MTLGPLHVLDLLLELDFLFDLGFLLDLGQLLAQGLILSSSLPWASFVNVPPPRLLYPPCWPPCLEPSPTPWPPPFSEPPLLIIIVGYSDSIVKQDRRYSDPKARNG